MITSAPASTVAVLIHDGYYGHGTGAGAANRAFLRVLAEVLPADVRLLLLPVRLAPDSPEHREHEPQDLAGVLARAEVHPLDNGTSGTDRFGGVANFRALAAAAGQVLRDQVGRRGESCLCIAFDVPFFGLAETAPEQVQLVLVPRSTGMLHQPQDLARTRWERHCLLSAVRRGARIGWISRFMAEHLRTDYRVPPAALVALPDGLTDADRPSPAAELLPPGADPVVLGSPNLRNGFLLSFGRAEPYKGFQDLIAALALVRRRRPPALVLAAVSEGPGRTRFQQRLVAELRATGVPAVFLGDFDPRIRSLLTRPELRGVIVPSRSEPFGRIPLEAHAAGAAPVVATRAGGLAEQITDGHTGFSAEPADPASLAAALTRALELTPAARARMRRAAMAATVHFDHRLAVIRFLRANGYGVGAEERRTG
ncbi:glycosyltransferase family 4 protein [Saccharopolyspora gregorii]|uniref:glycosyltransferase family 4 protein n=1 Tax=Saccharopolyspora gregorii TaxID=33914 RepID=UPI0021ACA78A|nr:glycosyltransferase family 4 protein [Saccharopolyspora gregorii]